MRRRPFLALGIAGMAGVFAQNATAQTVEEVVVVGVRPSLETSQQIKMDADTFVDSDTVTDIGAFPDKSMAEHCRGCRASPFPVCSRAIDSTHLSAEPAEVSSQIYPRQ